MGEEEYMNAKFHNSVALLLHHTADMDEHKQYEKPSNASRFLFQQHLWMTVCGDVTIKSASIPVMSDLIKCSLPRCFLETKQCEWQTWMSTCRVVLKLTYEEISFHLSLLYFFWVKSVSVLLTSQNSVFYSVLTVLLP